MVPRRPNTKTPNRKRIGRYRRDGMIATPMFPRSPPPLFCNYTLVLAKRPIAAGTSKMSRSFFFSLFFFFFFCELWTVQSRWIGRTVQRYPNGWRSITKRTDNLGSTTHVSSDCFCSNRRPKWMCTSRKQTITAENERGRPIRIRGMTRFAEDHERVRQKKKTKQKSRSTREQRRATFTIRVQGYCYSTHDTVPSVSVLRTFGYRGAPTSPVPGPPERSLSRCMTEKKNKRKKRRKRKKKRKEWNKHTTLSPTSTYLFVVTTTKRTTSRRHTCVNGANL